jgi:hypothetical protein
MNTDNLTWSLTCGCTICQVRNEGEREVVDIRIPGPEADHVILNASRLLPLLLFPLPGAVIALNQ